MLARPSMANGTIFLLSRELPCSICCASGCILPAQRKDAIMASVAPARCSPVAGASFPASLLQ